MTSAAMLTAMRTTRHSVRHRAPEPAGLHLRTRAWNESWYTLANQRNRTTRGGKSSVLPVHLCAPAVPALCTKLTGSVCVGGVGPQPAYVVQYRVAARPSCHRNLQSGNKLLEPVNRAG